jgi:hypothetical protein
MSDIRRDIESRFNALHALLGQTESRGGASLMQEFFAVKVRYSLTTSPVKILCKESSEYIPELERIIQAENFHYDVQRIAVKAKNLVLDNYVLHQLAQSLSNPSGVPQSIETTDFNQCQDCSAEMRLVPDSNILICPQCHRLTVLNAAICNDPQYSTQEGQKGKSGNFKPNRHYRVWVSRILAREPETEIGDKSDPDNIYGEKLLVLVKQIMERDRLYQSILTNEGIRKILVELKRTDLNYNCSQILCRTTGRSPPNTSSERIAYAEMLFTRVLQARENITTPQVNRRYYPYYIYKIYEHIIPIGDPEREILKFIHLQGDETLSKSDEEWKQICEIVPELEWQPTIRQN